MNGTERALYVLGIVLKALGWTLILLALGNLLRLWVTP